MSVAGTMHIFEACNRDGSVERNSRMSTMTYGVINTWGTDIHGESRTRDCSVESSIRPPATRELIVLMIASPTSDAARLLSWIGSSIL